MLLYIYRSMGVPGDALADENKRENAYTVGIRIWQEANQGDCGKLKQKWLQ